MKRTTPIPKIPLEVVLSAAKLTHPEARFAVANYYQFQEMRKRADMQLRHLGDREMPVLLHYTADAFADIENNVRQGLLRYAESHKIGRWMMSHHGIAEVISAGFLAHLAPEHPLKSEKEIGMYPDKKPGDLVPTRTVGHWWRFAGLDPSRKWVKSEKRPWNAALKQVCFHAGQCFKRVSGKGALATAPKSGEWIELEISTDDWRKARWHDGQWMDDQNRPLTIAKPEKEAKDDQSDEEDAAPKKWRPGWRPVGKLTPSFYGGLYRDRKTLLIVRNEAGHNAERAKTFVTTSKEAKALLKTGKLPAGNIDLQACRFATKIFLSHLHAVWFYDHFGKPPPAPFALTVLGHAHEIRIPNTDVFPGFDDAYYGAARRSAA